MSLCFICFATTQTTNMLCPYQTSIVPAATSQNTMLSLFPPKFSNETPQQGEGHQYQYHSYEHEYPPQLEQEEFNLGDKTATHVLPPVGVRRVPPCRNGRTTGRFSVIQLFLPLLLYCPTTRTIQVGQIIRVVAYVSMSERCSTPPTPLRKGVQTHSNNPAFLARSTAKQ